MVHTFPLRFASLSGHVVHLTRSLAYVHWCMCSAGSYLWHAGLRPDPSKGSDSQLCRAGTLNSTWVSAGELLSGASYTLTDCLCFKHFSLPESHITGVHSEEDCVGCWYSAWARHILSLMACLLRLQCFERPRFSRQQPHIMACMQSRKSHMLMMCPLRTVHSSSTGLRPVRALPTILACVWHQVLQQQGRIRARRS